MAGVAMCPGGERDSGGRAEEEDAVAGLVEHDVGAPLRNH